MRRRYSGRSTPSRKFVWARASGTLSPAAAVGGVPPFAPPVATDLLAPFEAAYGASLIGCTIVRIRGAIQMIDTPAADTRVRVTVNVGSATEVARAQLASDNAYDASTAALDYMVHEPFILPNSSSGLDSGDPLGRMIDVKSMRKIEEMGDALILRASASSLVAAASGDFDLMYDLSIGIKLP